MFENIRRWFVQMYHRSQGHLLVTIATSSWTRTFYAVSVFNKDGMWFADDYESGLPVTLRREYSVTITGA